jgi:hypothetical protein
MIKRCDHVGMMALCERDHRGTHDPERKVAELLAEVGDSFPLRVEHWVNHELSVGDRRTECHDAAARVIESFLDVASQR